jgi:hypothetical protein
VALQLASLTRASPTFVPWSTGTLVASYAIALVRHGGGIDPVAPLFGAGLLLAAELSYWSIELARLKALPAALPRRRAGTVAALVLGGMGLAAATVLVAAVPLGPGSLLRGAGAVAAVATVATLAALVHRDRAEGQAGGSGPEL